MLTKFQDPCHSERLMRSSQDNKHSLVGGDWGFWSTATCLKTGYGDQFIDMGCFLPD